MAKSKKASNVEKTAVSAPSNLSAEPMTPKMGILFSSCFCVLILILVTHLYSMTSLYVFNDTLNYETVSKFKDTSSFWTKLLFSGTTTPLSQPWLRSTYAWDISSFGFAPGWSHAVNICLHVLSCIYFYFFTFQISWRLNLESKTKIDPYYIAAAATALLACHPLVTGSIAYVSGRAGVLGAANYFLALNFFLYAFYESKLWRACAGYILFFVFTAIGILSNIQCLTIPLLGLALVFILKPPVVSIKEWVTDRSSDIILLVIIGISFGYLIRFGIPEQIDNGYGLPVLAAPIYWATQAKMLLMYYIRCVLAPIGLSVYPPYIAVSGWSDPGAICGALSVTVLGVIGLMQRQPQVQIATMIFLLNLLPWVVRDQREISADARFYLSLSGLCLAAGVGIAYLAAKDLRKTAIGFGILLVAFVSLCIWRETEWSTNNKLWRSEIKKSPADARPHAYLAADLLDAKKTGEARIEIDKALKLNKDDFIAHLVNGYYYLKQADNAHSKPEFQKAIEVGTKLKMRDEDLAICRSRLVRSYYVDGDISSAYKEAIIAHESITNDGMLNLVIGKQQLADHMPLIALKTLEDGVKIDPTNAEFLVPIAEAALDCGMPQVLQHAYAAAKRATQVRPSLKASKLYIRACLEFGSPEEARGLLETLRKTEPKDAEIKWLAYGYAKQAGNTSEAEKLRKEALAIDPTLEKRIKFGLKKGNALNSKVPAVVLPPAQVQSAQPANSPSATDQGSAQPASSPSTTDHASAPPANTQPTTDHPPVKPAELAPKSTR